MRTSPVFLTLAGIIGLFLHSYAMPPTVETFTGNYSTHPQFSENPLWYDITIGYAELASPPPADSFIIQDMPKAMSDAARVEEFTVMGGQVHTKADYSLVRTDPLGQMLRQPFALGQLTYALVKEDGNNGILLSFYHYNANNVDWSVSERSGGSTYELNEIIIEAEQAVPSNSWFVFAAEEKHLMTLERNERKTQTVYTYFFIKVMRGLSP